MKLSTNESGPHWFEMKDLPPAVLDLVEFLTSQPSRRELKGVAARVVWRQNSPSRVSFMILLVLLAGAQSRMN